jgi:esterase/lipase
MKNILIIVSVLIFIYLAVGLYLHLNQISMIHHPSKQDFDDCPAFNDYENKNHLGTRFYLKHNPQSDTVIIDYHGNAGSACGRVQTKALLEQSAASLIFVEYAGYSNDTVKPSKKLILKDVENIHDYLNKSDYKNIIVYGQSIGSGPASYHASIGEVNKLILVTPFYNFIDLVNETTLIYPLSLILTENYDNSAWLEEYQGDLLIVHADQDTVIPQKFSKQLFHEAKTKNKKYFTVKNTNHNNLTIHSDFKKKIVDYFNK